MRQLATIQKISNVVHHPNADALDICTVLGWKVVTKRDEFKAGDYCVYCEVDSVLPKRPEFEFLAPRNYRIRTVKLRGEISQGICFPLSILGDEYFLGLTSYGQPYYVEPKIGDEVTDILDIVKYEPPIPANLGGKVRGNFPSFLFKTDETRIQSIPEIIDTLDGVSMYVTEKLDGSSSTFYLKDGQFGVCSRNWDLDETDDNSFWRVARREGIEDKLCQAGINVSIQGELMGEGVQKNKLGLKDVHFFAFQVYDIDSGRYYDYDEFVDFCNTFGFKTVPIIDADFKTLGSVDEYVEYVTRNSSINPSVNAEGFVFRAKTTPSTGRISFKCINPNFLLKYDDA